MPGFDIYNLPSPCYVVDETRIEKNLKTLRTVIEQSNCRILLAQKAFSMFALYPLIGRYLHGTTASSLFEARLGYEHMGGETHIFSPAYVHHEFEQILELCDHLVFNSFHQWHSFKAHALHAGKSCGLRVNPQCSTQEHPIYDPCAPGSRLGITSDKFTNENLDGLRGLHFHTLCEQNADALAITLEAMEEKFGSLLHNMEWLNLGGGHHITREDYDTSLLLKCIKHLQDKYSVTVYLEPGEAIALNAGFLVCTVVDIVKTEALPVLVLDASAACHMPDVLEMPYRPPLLHSGDEKPHRYRLAGPTCLAGDIIGDYSFDKPVKRGTRLVFADMAIYSMVKNNTFNGINLPAIALHRLDRQLQVIKTFGYEDFKNRLS